MKKLARTQSKRPAGRRSGRDARGGRQRLDLSSTRGAEVQQLLDELQIHQAELEMQNEQLRQSEEALRQSEGRFRAAQEMSLVAFTLLDAVRNRRGAVVDFRWTYVNPQAGRLLRRSPAKLVGRRLLDVLPGNRANSDLFERYVRVVETGEALDYEVRYESEGIHGWFQNMTVKLGDGIAVSFTDITERKRAEAALRQTTERERFLADVVEHAAVPLGIGAEDGRLLLFNQAFANLTGYSRAELEQKQVSWATDLTPPEWRAAEAKHLAVARRTRQPVRYEKEYLRKDGRRVPIELFVQPLTDPNGGSIHYRSFLTDITERKRAEEVLRRSEAQVRLALSAAKAASWTWDLKSNRTVWSPEYYPLYGFNSKVRPTPQNWLRRIHPADRKGVKELVQRTLKDRRKEFIFEFRIRHPDRGERWIANRGSVVYSAQGKAIGATGINLDITEHKRAEQELKELNATLERRVAERTAELTDAHDRLRTITDSALIGILTLDKRGLIKTLNRAAATIFGHPPDGVVGRRLGDLITLPKGSRGKFFAHWTQSTGRRLIGVGREVLGRREGGYPVLLEFTVSDFIHGGKREYVALVHDVTERNRAETALRQSEEQFRLIMDNLADLVAVLDLKGHRLYNSPSYSQILGDPAVLRGTSSFAEVHAEDRPRVEQVFKETARTGVGQRLDYRMIDRSGQVRHIESQGSVIRDEQGRVAKVVVVSRDVTTRRRAEEQLHRLSASLLRAQDQERRRLARELHDSTAQHLAALTLNLGQLGRTLPPTSPSAQTVCGECLELANQAAQEIRTHAYLLHPPLLEVMGLAGAIEEYAQGLSARRGLKIEVEIPADFGRLPEDMELALFRVTQESLANVLKHSGAQRVKIRLTRRASWVALEVQDQGHGIPGDVLARLKARSGGSGVGLAGMHERLRLLGGRLDLQSGPSGTTIRAIVPLPVPPAEPPPAV